MKEIFTLAITHPGTIWTVWLVLLAGIMLGTGAAVLSIARAIYKDRTPAPKKTRRTWKELKTAAAADIKRQLLGR